MMASAAVNGAIGLDFSAEAKGGGSRTNSESPYEEDYPSMMMHSPYEDAMLSEDESNQDNNKDTNGGKQEDGEVTANNHASMEEPSLLLQQMPVFAKKRRKQSNPVRIASTRVLNEPVDEPDDGPLDLATTELSDRAPPNSSSPELSLLRCPHCTSIFDTEDSLRVHIEEEHVQKLLEQTLHHQGHGKMQAAANDVNFITAGIAMRDTDMALDMSTSFQNASSESNDGHGKNALSASHLPPTLTPEGRDTPANMLSPLATSASFGPPPFLIPLTSQGPMNTNNGPPIRIFNPEAYCELCNKEFCNKYFLKTHKANKHGIYCMDSLTTSPYAGAFISANMTAALSMRSLLSAPTTPTSSTDYVSTMSTISVKSSGPLNMDAYCEICQKEFCNKYFLRKHKQKIHGIIMDLPPTTSAMPTSTLGLNGNNISPTSTLDSPISSSSTTSVTSVTMANNFESVCDLCNKDFGSRSQLQNHKYVVHSTPPSAPIPISTPISTPAPMSGLYTPSSASQSEDEKGFLVQRLDNKPGLGFFTPERLREIGVINPEAFCELCCKEFCNKYFLRTHKEKKHGITAQDQSSSKSNASPAAAMLTPSEKGPSMDDAKKFEALQNGVGSLDLSNQGEESSDLSCDVCGRPFASVYLLKMHKFYSHNIQPGDQEDETVNGMLQFPEARVKDEPGQDKAENLVKSERPEAPGEDLRKLQSMIQELNAPSKENFVSCTICHKEMENKYFLRAHMMNEHGMLHCEDSVMDAFIKSTNMSKDQNFLSRYPFLSQQQPPVDSETWCEICKKDFGTKYFLHIHKTNVHGIPMDLSMSQNHSEPSATSSSVIQPLRPNPDPMPAPSNVTNERPSVITGRNYCEICNKELCNKYFMKTHMLKMHGINVEDCVTIKGTATIGGVICDICQKELCSKYFLKVHKQNTHGILEESPSGKENIASRLSTPEKDLGLMPGEITDDNSRYFSHYTEVCTICDRRFKSIKWLKTHMINDHSDRLKENGLNAPSANPDIFSKSCLVCGKFFNDAVALQVHMIHHHYNGQGAELQGFTDSSIAKPVVPSLLPGSNKPPADIRSSGSACSQRPRVRPEGPLHKRSGNGTRIYHCSYCAYATRWLSNLYAHEKRHTGLAKEGEKKFPCRLCPRAYRYNHSLQRHLLSHRGTLPRSIIVPSAEPVTSSSVPLQHNGNGDNPPQLFPLPPRRTKKFRCSKCFMKFRSRQFCLAHIHDVHGLPPARAPRLPLMTATFQKGIKIFKCRRCGFTTCHLHVLKQHIRQQHRDAIISNNPVSTTNHPVSTSSKKDHRPKDNGTSSSANDKDDPNGHPQQHHAASVATSVITSSSTTPSKTSPTPSSVQIPMTYAMPQNPPTAGSFIMQPFLMAQPLDNLPPPNPPGPPKVCGTGGTFVPSLVYLPVCQKVSEPITIAFTLTPA